MKNSITNKQLDNLTNTIDRSVQTDKTVGGAA